MTVENCIFNTNHGALSGGVFQVQISSLAVTASQFSGNQAENGGCLYLEDSAVSLSGNTFTGNAAASAGGVVVLDSATTVTSNSNMFTSNVVSICLNFSH